MSRKAKRTQNLEKLDEAMGLADLGAIDEREFERRWEAAGGILRDGNIEDATDEQLAAMYSVAAGGMKLYLASLIVARGLTACGCEHCQKVEAYAKRWDEQ
jgi:hypothetical protein